MNRISVSSIVFLYLLFLPTFTPQSSAQKLPAHPEPPGQNALSKSELVELDRFEWVTLQFGGPFLSPVSIQEVAQSIEGRTTLILHPQQRWIDYKPNRLREFPFLHLEMCVPPPKMSLHDKFMWRDFFNAGGALFLDACEGNDAERSSLPVSKLHRQWRHWGQSIFPNTGWSPLNRNHVLTFSFYLLDKRTFLEEYGTPIHLLENDGRVILILNHSPRWSWETLKHSGVSVNLNPEPHESRLRLYINLLMLLLTGDYKNDQQHLPTILLRRK